MNNLDKYRDPALDLKLEVVQVDPFNRNIERAALTGVISASVTQGYYTDTRISAKLKTLDDNLIDGSWLRLYVVEEGQRIAFGTFVVENFTQTEHTDVVRVREYSLQSTIWACSEDRFGWHFSANAGSTVKQTWENLSKICASLDIMWLGNAHNATYNNACVWAASDAVTTIEFDMASKANNRLDVDGYGRHTMGAYVEPARKEPIWLLDPTHPRTVVLGVSPSTEDKTGQAYDRTIVIHKTQGDQEIIAVSNTGTNDLISSRSRGFLRAKVHELSDMSPATYDEAKRRANAFASNDRSRGRTRKVECMWFDAHAGDCLLWLPTQTKYLIKNAEHNLDTWKVSLDLKEV